MPTDIAIVGGGPAGLSLAVLLERHGYNYVLFERDRINTPPRGTSLDLHPGAGQRVIEEAGLQQAFNNAARRGAATVHRVFNYKLEPMFSWGENRDAPEIDRGDLRNVLLSGIKPNRIQYDKNLREAVRGCDGKIVLRFTDGSEESGFKLVVGADGVFSKVRPLVSTTAQPIFLNQFYLSFKMFQDNPMFAENLERAKEDPMVIVGKNSHVWNMRQGDGSFQTDFGISGVRDFVEADKLDRTNIKAVKEFLLQDEYFGQYDPWVHKLINSLEPARDGSVHRWMLHIMPAELIEWEPRHDVTLMGDAAHATTPYVGEGVNCAMRDACLLVEQLQRSKDIAASIAAYEQKMKPIGIDLVTRSLKSGTNFYNEDAGESLMRSMKARNRLLGVGDKTFVVGEVEV